MVLVRATEMLKNHRIEYFGILQDAGEDTLCSRPEGRRKGRRP